MTANFKFPLRGSREQISAQVSYIQQTYPRVPLRLDEQGFSYVPGEIALKVVLHGIYSGNVSGWWHYKSELIEHGIATYSQIIAKLNENLKVLRHIGSPAVTTIRELEHAITSGPIPDIADELKKLQTGKTTIAAKVMDVFNSDKNTVIESVMEIPLRAENPHTTIVPVQEFAKVSDEELALFKGMLTHRGIIANNLADFDSGKTKFLETLIKSGSLSGLEIFDAETGAPELSTIKPRYAVGDLFYMRTMGNNWKVKITKITCKFDYDAGLKTAEFLYNITSDPATYVKPLTWEDVPEKSIILMVHDYEWDTRK